MLLPVFAILVAPGLPVFARALEIVPALIAILLKVIARLLPLVGALVPCVVTAVHTLLPLVVSVLRALAPVRSLLGTHRAFAGSRPFADARPLCRKLGRTAGKCSPDGTTCRSASGDSQEISDITAARALGGFGARTPCSSAAGLAGAAAKVGPQPHLVC